MIWLSGRLLVEFVMFWLMDWNVESSILSSFYPHTQVQCSKVFVNYPKLVELEEKSNKKKKVLTDNYCVPSFFFVFVFNLRLLHLTLHYQARTVHETVIADNQINFWDT